MDLYPVLVFLHVAGACGLFAVMGVGAFALLRLRGTDDPDEARALLPQVERPGGPVAPLSGVLIIGAGVWMMLARWGLQAWMVASLASIVLMGVAVGVLTREPLARLTAALGGDAPQADWHVQARDPRMYASLWVRTVLLLGIIGLMTVKPAVVGSIVLVVASAVGGLAVAALANRSSPATAGR